jgi:SSS family solute:Na+ symporter
MLATQCSTNSILGAPAFIAFSLGGGLIWMQYELALPFAMAIVLLFLYPTLRALKLVSIYAFLEERFDRSTRLTLSATFQIIRALATSVTVYGITLLTSRITGLDFFWSVVLFGAFTLAYDYLGGIQGVIYSDVIQMGILTTMLLGIAVIMLGEAGSFSNLFDALPESRRTALDFSHHGLGDGADFAFWPMMIGGALLYVSYYGCDQSQMQRLLAARSIKEGQKALAINGLLRFPLVGLYCFLGVGLAYYAIYRPEFMTLLALQNGATDYNLALPAFMATHLPPGLLGLGFVALFAAAMSSLDSVINSLSAASVEDFLKPLIKGGLTNVQELRAARATTLIWGLLTLGGAFFVGDISDSILVAINKVGSLLNGPILGVFVLGLTTRRVSGRGARLGFVLGLTTNVYLWVEWTEISWLWWNLIGLVITVGVGLLDTLRAPRQAVKAIDPIPLMVKRSGAAKLSGYLCLYGFGLLLLLYLFEKHLFSL